MSAGEPDKLKALLSSIWSSEWSCPHCGRPFNSHTTVHTCGPHTVREYLDGRPATAVALYRAFAQLIRTCGPVIVVPTRTTVAFQTHVTFASVDRLTGRGMRAHVVLREPIVSPRFTAVEEISPLRHRHRFVACTTGDLDAEVGGWLRAAYAATSR